MKLAAQGNVIPVTRRLLADIETPLSAYRKIRGAGESFLFESVEGGEHLGRYSFVGCNPRAVIRQTENRVEVLENGKAASRHFPSGKDVKDGFVVVERVMKKHRAVSLPGTAAIHRRRGRLHRVQNSSTTSSRSCRARRRTN